MSPSKDGGEDMDTDEVLKVFDFLPTDEMDTSPDHRSSGDGTDWGEMRAPCWGFIIVILPEIQC